MRNLALKIWDRLLSNTEHRTAKAARRPWKKTPMVEALEDRSIPATLAASGALSGVAFIDSGHTGTLTGASTPTSSISIQLTGTTTTGTAVNMTTTTDAAGNYDFLDLAPGTYQAAIASGQNLVSSNGSTASGIVIGTGQIATENLDSAGLAPSAISLRQFLTTTAASDFAFQALNDTPTVKAAISNVMVTENAAATTVDLAANFTDASMTNTILQFNTSEGPVDVKLFDSQTPQTVANFLDYVESDAFESSVFHRLVTQSGLEILQGGGFTLNSTATQISTIPTGPAVADEQGVFNNTQGTLAMANAGANTATDQFYFNLAANPGLDASAGADFTVFGTIVGTASQPTLTTLGATPTPLGKSILTSSDVFVSMPLNNFTGTTFPSGDGAGPYALPSGLTAANFQLVNNVAVVSRGDFLTYSVIANTNPSLVSPVVNSERLKLNYTPNMKGSATITVRATDKYGVSTDTTFTVTVS